MNERAVVLKYLLMAFMAKATLLALDEDINTLRNMVKIANFGDDADRKLANTILDAVEEYRKA